MTGILLVSVAAVLWGTTGVANSMMAESAADPALVGLARTALGALSLLVAAEAMHLPWAGRLPFGLLATFGLAGSVAGETLHGLAQRHDLSRSLIRVWVEKYEAGAFDEDARAADLIQAYEARIAALERLVGRQALELEFIKGALRQGRPTRSERMCVITGPPDSGDDDHLGDRLNVQRPRWSHAPSLHPPTDRLDERPIEASAGSAR